MSMKRRLPLTGTVVTLSVTRNITSGRVLQRQGVLMCQELRLPLTGSRWDIRWLSVRGMTPTLCVFPVFSVAVMEKCCDACGDRKYYFRSGWLASQGACVSRATIADHRQSMGQTVAERSWKDADFLCTFCI
jgi:hypothetical protein